MAIWFAGRHPSVEVLNAHAPRTLVGHVDIRFIEVGDDFLRATMPVDARTRQPYGVLHGGASVVLAETMGSTGAAACIDQERFQCFGQEINANHLRGVKSGWVIGTARPFHLGSTSHVWGIEIRTEDGKLVCVSRITMAILKLKKDAAG